MVVTTLEARVDPEKADALVSRFESAVAELPAAIVETFLMHAREADLWRIVTVWRSEEELGDYRASVDVPEGVKMFRAAGAEPGLSIFDVVAHGGG